MLIEKARVEVVEYARRLVPDGLVVGTAGNISVRVGELMAVTPSGLDYDKLTPELVCVCDLDGNQVEGPLKPTSEMPMHLAVYRNTEHTAVVHTHSTAATVVSTLVDELPAIHYVMAFFGGPVRVSPYATFGTQQLAENMLRALEGRTGCILGNHGTLTVAGDLAKAYTLSQTLEWLCEVWLRAKAVGEPRLLPPEEIANVAARVVGYGQQPPEET
jgi:L-fuculose-phosphate aldolase